jgi:hypothetical protein
MQRVAVRCIVWLDARVSCGQQENKDAQQNADDDESIASPVEPLVLRIEMLRTKRSELASPIEWKSRENQEDDADEREKAGNINKGDNSKANQEPTDGKSDQRCELEPKQRSQIPGHSWCITHDGLSI